MTSFAATSRPTSIWTFIPLGLIAFVVAFGSFEAASPSYAEAGKTKRAKKVLKFVSNGARKFERKMRSKGKFGRALGKAVGKVGRGAGKLRKGISKVQRGVGRVVGKVCKGPCAKALRAGRKIKHGIDRLKRRAVRRAKKGLGKLARGVRRHRVRRGNKRLHPIGGRAQRAARRNIFKNRSNRRLRYKQPGRRILGNKVRRHQAFRKQVITPRHKALVRRR